jgi:hypothetical protein
MTSRSNFGKLLDAFCDTHLPTWHILNNNRSFGGI